MPNGTNILFNWTTTLRRLNDLPHALHIVDHLRTYAVGPSTNQTRCHSTKQAPPFPTKPSERCGKHPAGVGAIAILSWWEVFLIESNLRLGWAPHYRKALSEWKLANCSDDFLLNIYNIFQDDCICRMLADTSHITSNHNFFIRAKVWYSTNFAKKNIPPYSTYHLGQCDSSKECRSSAPERRITAGRLGKGISSFTCASLSWWQRFSSMRV